MGKGQPGDTYPQTMVDGSTVQIPRDAPAIHTELLPAGEVRWDGCTLWIGTFPAPDPPVTE